MTLAPGMRLGTYEVLAPLGAGGMGEVYRARDTKLGREVALKVLPDACARDPDRLARFEREARALAALSHPAIATIHGLEESGDVRFIVMELVPGQTLEELLAAGTPPLPDALRIAHKIADALEAAHARGIVHRDLKPSNVKVMLDGEVKVLDFGLAKSFLPASGLSESPTVTAQATQAGIVLGTPSYMSPEQARGRPVDKRTDLWSFGCVLYELLTGRRAFDGDTASDRIAAILDREPDWSALPKSTPIVLRQLLHRCLEKQADRRLRDVGDARLEIDEAIEALSRGAATRKRRRLPTAAAATAAALGLVFLAIVVRRGSAPAPAPVQPRLSQVTFSEGIEEFPAWSPDGSALLYSTEVGGLRKIFRKLLATGEETPLTRGAFDDIQPAWSPDGRTVLFVRAQQPGRKLEPGDVFGQYDGGDVWALDQASGKESTLIQSAFNPSWSPDGTRIAVDASWVGPRRLWVTDSQGLNTQQATTDVSEAVAHLRPRWSPDGAKLAFQNVERTKFDIRVVDLVTKKLVWVTNDPAPDIGPVWSRSGRLLYFSSARSGGWNIWRVPVSADGSPVGSLQQLTTGAGQDVGLALTADGRGLAFAILRQNADIWRLPVSPATGKRSGAPVQVIATTREDSRGAWSPDGERIAFNSDRAGDMNIWVQSLRDGTARQLTRGPGGDYQPNWSPDGRSIAFFSSRAGSVDIWSVDVASGVLAPLTKGGSIDVNPFFSPDGKRIAYQSDRGGRLEVWVMNADGSEARQLTRVGVTGHFLRWTQDGQGVVFRCPCGGRPQTMSVGLDGGDPHPFANVTGGSHMSFSPDFSLIMDVVDHKTLWVSPLRSGRPAQVFQFEDPNVRIDYPVWSPDGRWVLFDRFRPQGGNIWMMTAFE